MSIFHSEVTPEMGPVPSGFNWGAFLFPAIFLIFNRRVGTVLSLMFGGGILGAALGDAGGFVLALVSLGLSLYCGFSAKEIAWDTGRYTTYAALEKSMRRWNVAAGTFGVIVVALFLFS